MKAWQLSDTGGIDSFHLNEIPEPDPGPGEVRVEVRYSALNHLDIWVSKGLPAPRSFPHTGGADAAGVIDTVGPGVSGFEVGDEIIIDPSMSCGQCDYCRNDEIVYCSGFGILGEHLPGTFAEKIVIPTINAVRKPAAMPWEVAGSIGLVNGTALRMLERAGLRPGQKLLVVGIGGGVSAAAMALGIGFRADVYVTSRSPEKIQWAIDQGAKGGFDSAGEFGKEMASLGGADVVVENVGPATLRQSMRAARPGGKIAICGSTSGAKVELTLPHLFFRHLHIIGSSMANHAEFSRAINWIGHANVKTHVSRVFGFDELREALRYLDSGEQIGKVAINHAA